MGKRGRKALAAGGGSHRRPVAPLHTGPPATTVTGRVKQSWQVAGQRPAKSGVVAVRASRPQRPARPPSLFGGLPVSEILILLGLIAVVVGLTRGPSAGGTPIASGVVLCTVAVAEFTAREHFRGYRSHTLLLALLTMIAVHTTIVLATGFKSPVLAAVDLGVFVSVALALRRRYKHVRAH